MSTLLLIPDISGFTRFVTETAAEHGRHIIAELLELLIDSNTLGLTVSEIEGDAVMFYGEHFVPDQNDVLEQAQRMFVDFHSHLRQYETRRICSCGACTSASSLTLKVVVHAGPVEFIRVKDFVKPFGSDTILVHRLLKNDIPHDEYILMTESVREEVPASPLPKWVQFETGVSSYDEIGEVAYTFASLTPLRELIREPPGAEDFQRIKHPIAVERQLKASMSSVHELLNNFEVRTLWNREVSEVEYTPDRVNRVGTTHRCIVDGRKLEFETITSDYGPDKTVSGERLDSPPLVDDLAVFNILTPEQSGCSLRLEVHYHSRPFPFSLLTPLFRVVAKRKLRMRLESIAGVVESSKPA